MDHAPRLGAGDPLALAGGGGDASVKASGQFERDPWSALFDPQEKPREIAVGLGNADAGCHLDAGLAQHGKTLPRDARVCILERGDNPRDARRNQRLGAGRGLSVMGAGFERDIGRGPTRRRARLRQRLRFGMGSAAGLGPATPDDTLAGGHDHAAHSRVRPCPPLPAPPQ